MFIFYHIIFVSILEVNTNTVLILINIVWRNLIIGAVMIGLGVGSILMRMKKKQNSSDKILDLLPWDYWMLKDIALILGGLAIIITTILGIGPG